MISFSGKDKIKAAQLEVKIEMLGVILEDKNTEIRRLKLELDRTKDFWCREFASAMQNGKAVEGAGLEFSDLEEPTEEDTNKQVAKAQKDYADYCFWNEGDGISYNPTAYLKEQTS